MGVGAAVIITVEVESDTLAESKTISAAAALEVDDESPYGGASSAVVASLRHLADQLEESGVDPEVARVINIATHDEDLDELQTA